MLNLFQHLSQNAKKGSERCRSALYDRHFVRGNAVVKDTDLHRPGSNTYNSFKMSFTLGLFR
jgi:hypothetical protein